MGRVTIFLAVCLALCVNEAVSGKLGKQELIDLAKNQLAPLTQTALGRVKGEIFGNGRAARSSDVILMNKTPKTFKLRENTCQWGGFSSDLFPEAELPPKSTTVYGVESNGFMSGVTCTVKYEVVENGQGVGEFVKFFVDNPYIGSNIEQSWLNGTFEIVSTLGQGNNNQVRYVIQQ